MQLYIEVRDYDSFNSNDHVDDIYANISLTPNSSFTLITTYNGVYGNSKIELSYRLQCGSNFYGNSCTTFCMARDDSEGHYSCGPDGEKICLSGWSDPSTDCKTCKLYTSVYT